MPRRIQIAPHLTPEELEQHYRQAKDSVERSHYQIIWLLAQGRRTEEVAQLTGYSRSWIYELVWGYNRLGTEAIGDKRRENAGAAPLLNDLQQAQLWQVLQEPLYFYRVHNECISTQRRMEQIGCSVRAVNDALERQGLSQQFELEVEIRSQFYLKPKPAELVVKDALTPKACLMVLPELSA